MIAGSPPCAIDVADCIVGPKGSLSGDGPRLKVTKEVATVTLQFSSELESV